LFISILKAALRQRLGHYLVPDQALPNKFANRSTFSCRAALHLLSSTQTAQ
jgi:hypothetical protein